MQKQKPAPKNSLRRTESSVRGTTQIAPQGRLSTDSIKPRALTQPAREYLTARAAQRSDSEVIIIGSSFLLLSAYAESLCSGMFPIVFVIVFIGILNVKADFSRKGEQCQLFLQNNRRKSESGKSSFSLIFTPKKLSHSSIPN